MVDIITVNDFSWLLSFIITRISIILVCWFFMVLSSIIDFWSGVSTAKALGEPIMSHGFRRTITKVGDYMKLMMFAFMFDTLGSLLSFYIIPFATILCTIAVILIEGKSVIENARKKKAHAADVPSIIKQIVHTVTTEQGIEVFNKILEEYSKENKH